MLYKTRVVESFVGARWPSTPHPGNFVQWLNSQPRTIINGTSVKSGLIYLKGGRSNEMCILPYHLEKFELGFNTFRVMDEPVLNEHRRLACKVVQDVCNSYRVTYNTNGTVWVSRSNDLEWWSVGGELVYRGKTIPYHVNIEMLDTVYRLRVTDPYADGMLEGDDRKGIPEPQACREFHKNRNPELADLMKKLDSSS